MAILWSFTSSSVVYLSFSTILDGLFSADIMSDEYIAMICRTWRGVDRGKSYLYIIKLVIPSIIVAYL